MPINCRGAFISSDRSTGTVPLGPFRLSVPEGVVVESGHMHCCHAGMGYGGEDFVAWGPSVAWELLTEAPTSMPTPTSRPTPSLTPKGQPLRVYFTPTPEPTPRSISHSNLTQTGPFDQKNVSPTPEPTPRSISPTNSTFDQALLSTSIIVIGLAVGSVCCRSSRARRVLFCRSAQVGAREIELVTPPPPGVSG